jgi:hypothetical protein
MSTKPLRTFSMLLTMVLKKTWLKKMCRLKWGKGRFHVFFNMPTPGHWNSWSHTEHLTRSSRVHNVTFLWFPFLGSRYYLIRKKRFYCSLYFTVKVKALSGNECSIFPRGLAEWELQKVATGKILFPVNNHRKGK